MCNIPPRKTTECLRHFDECFIIITNLKLYIPMKCYGAWLTISRTSRSACKVTHDDVRLDEVDNWINYDLVDLFIPK